MPGPVVNGNAEPGRVARPKLDPAWAGCQECRSASFPRTPVAHPHKSILAIPALLAACYGAPPPGGPPSDSRAPAEPYPLGPEMLLLEKDAGSEEYRGLLRSQSANVNVLNAEWERVKVADGPGGLPERPWRGRAGSGRPALPAAHERRRKIADRFLDVLREEYAFRGKKAPSEKEEAPPAGSLSAPGARDPHGAAPAGAGGRAPVAAMAGARRHGTLGGDRPARAVESDGERGLEDGAPGPGQLFAVIWDERIFLTTAFDQGGRRSLLCVSRADGAILWIVDAPAVPPEGRVIQKNGYASATPAVDGERVVVFFGNGGLAAFDLEGKLLWQHPLPPFDAMHGTGASPLIDGDLVILFQEQSSKPSMGIAVDKRTGERRWRIEREPALGWCTPLALRIAGPRPDRPRRLEDLVAYDPVTGAEIWSCRGPTHEVIPTVIAGHGLVFCASGRSGPMLAMPPGRDRRPRAKGISWSSPRGAPHVPSPVLSGELLYQVNDLGIITCFRARTGEVLFQKRLGGTFSASPWRQAASLLHERGRRHDRGAGRPRPRDRERQLPGRDDSRLGGRPRWADLHPHREAALGDRGTGRHGGKRAFRASGSPRGAGRHRPPAEPHGSHLYTWLLVPAGTPPFCPRNENRSGTRVRTRAACIRRLHPADRNVPGASPAL